MARAKMSKKTIDDIITVSSIVSITSAPCNWNAVFVDSEGEVWFEPIACFALCEVLQSKKKVKFVRICCI